MHVCPHIHAMRSQVVVVVTGVMMIKRKRKKKGEQRRERRAGGGKRKISPQDRRPTEYRLGLLFQYQGHPKLMRGCDNGT